MKKEYEDYLKERGLPSPMEFFREPGFSIYPAAVPEEIAQAIFAELFGDQTQSAQQSNPSSPLLDPTNATDQRNHSHI